MQTVTHSAALSRFGCALSDPTRAEILLMLRDAPDYPSELADPRIGHALGDLVGLVLTVDPACCPAAEPDACC